MKKEQLNKRIKELEAEVGELEKVSTPETKKDKKKKSKGKDLDSGITINDLRKSKSLTKRAKEKLKEWGLENNLSDSESDKKSIKGKIKTKDGDEVVKLLRDLQIKIPDSASSKGKLDQQKGKGKSDSHKKPKVVQFSDSQKFLGEGKQQY